MRRKEQIRRRRRNKAAMLCISLVVIFLLGILLLQGESLKRELAGYQEQEKVFQEKIADEKARTEEIDKKKEYMGSDAFIEETARDRLGLVKDNEYVFKEEQGE